MERELGPRRDEVCTQHAKAMQIGSGEVQRETRCRILLRPRALEGTRQGRGRGWGKHETHHAAQEVQAEGRAHLEVEGVEDEALHRQNLLARICL